MLQANFRNTRAVTDLANTLLKIKQARFGSIDRESNFLVRSASAAMPGAVTLCPAEGRTLSSELDAAHPRSRRAFAVIVLRDEDKAAAQAQFHTPLRLLGARGQGTGVRPHRAATGFVSGQRAAYAEVCDGVTAPDLAGDELDYRRAKDKSDKSLELYKFYVNALYVAMTRAVQNLYLVESDTGIRCCACSACRSATARRGDDTASSKEEWAQEARKLELQGKQEQAEPSATFLQARAGALAGVRRSTTARNARQGLSRARAGQQDQAATVRLRRLLSTSPCWPMAVRATRSSRRGAATSTRLRATLGRKHLRPLLRRSTSRTSCRHATGMASSTALR